MIVVIPARLDSRRLKEKLLLKINNKTILEHTFLQAKKSQAEKIIVATDSEEIFNQAKNFDAEVCMTSGKHKSGTERLAEVVKIYQFADEVTIVNLQGDEPLMPQENINKVGQILESDQQAVMSTLATPQADDLTNKNFVKVVCDKNNYALYFSRSLIPYIRNNNNFQHLRHLGIYAYKTKFLKTYDKLASCKLETTESLEQLRVLWHGFKIKVATVDDLPAPGIDNEQDFLLVKKLMEDNA